MLHRTLYQVYLLVFLSQIVANAQTSDHEDEIFYSDSDAIENPEETGPYFEGDINGEAEEIREYQRNGIVSASLRWPQATVPYIIQGSFSPDEQSIINHAFDEYHTKTCVRFRKRSSEKDYIVISNKPTGCWSSLGRIGGRQVVNLESGKCFATYGTTIHELMHALGFYHEQNRFERDFYIKVIKENIKPNMLVNFEKLTQSIATGYGVAYDYASVMHYKPTSFSKNGKPTLRALQAMPEGTKMGQRYGFSKGDILKIKAMYRCK